MFEHKPIIIVPQMIKAIRKHVWKRGPNECWIWYPIIDRYGQMHIHYYNNGIRTMETFRPHRVAYVIANGPFDWDLNINHTCDNPPCCNPGHLWPGTQQEGMADMLNKGRRASTKGEKNGRAKLTPDDIKKIFFKRAMGYTLKELGKEFSVSFGQIGHILNHGRWEHLDS